jgi:cell fate regulator YaaT (PSP1 superfamily)
MNEKDENKTVAEEVVPAPMYEIVGVRFKTTGKIYYFDPQGLKPESGDNVIVETARGLEFGKVVIPNRIVGEDKVVLPLRPVIRCATKEDIVIYEENKRKEKEAAKICLEKIAEHKLEMKLVDVEYTFDNNKLLFYFTAEGRVDFRELVKSLASIFRTRIELRQIGIRDETKLIGGLGVCGRPFCCKKFLDDFCQVSIKMAKEQNLSLNSQKISGACGRLMCCLRYEHELYEEELAKLPRLDALVETPDGRGVVCELSPLCGLVKVRFGGDHPSIKTYTKDSIKIIANTKKEQKELRESEGKAQPKKEN